MARAERVYGGYAPSATFRLLLGDGRRAFVKATYPLPEESAVKWSLAIEERAYRSLGPRIRPWAPRFFGSARAAGWHAIVLEDLGPATVPPWTPAKVRRSARDYAAFHRRGRRATPRGRQEWRDFARLWREADPRSVAALARRRRDEAEEWLDVAWPVLNAAAERTARMRVRTTLLHLDTRSDNIRVTPEGLRVFDWNFASPGPAEFDVGAFAQSIEAEGGPGPEVFVAAYREVGPLDDGVLACCMAAISGYFAARAPLPDRPELPRLRRWQAQQLAASLGYAARLLSLPEPRWVAALR